MEPVGAPCVLAPNPGEGGCGWCGAPIEGRRTRWCSDRCSRTYSNNHWWPAARRTARRRDSYRCCRCGRGRKDGLRLEVNHIEPCLGDHARVSCAHHLANLETLCHECHGAVTRSQRTARATPAAG